MYEVVKYFEYYPWVEGQVGGQGGLVKYGLGPAAEWTICKNPKRGELRMSTFPGVAI